MSTINVTNLSGRGGATPNLPDGANITGVATASGGFSGNLTGNVTGTGLTTGSDGSINVTSIRSVGVSTLGNVVITGAVGGGATVGAYAGVTTFYGDGSNLTGAGDSIAPWHYNPDIGDTEVMLDELKDSSGIGITFNKKVVAGSGTATLKIVNAGAAGTTIQSWGVGSCTFNVTALTLGTLVSDLTLNQTYQLDIPGTFVNDAAGTAYVGTAYTFTATGPVSKLFSWGQATSGMRGLNNDVRYSSPVQVGGLGWSEVSNSGSKTSDYFEYAIKNDGTLWAWGNNTYGTLAQNNLTFYSSPVQVGSDTTWNIVSSAYYGGLSVKTDGTLWSWGYNYYGQGGVNNTTKYSSPVQVGSDTTWSKDETKLMAMRHKTAAIKTDGTLWVWGKNEKGQLGLNNTTTYSSPVQVPGTTWSAVNGNETILLATKTDGTMWSCGENDYGQLGLNQPHGLKISSPTQIPGTSWSTVATGDQKFNFAKRTDGTLWAWGNNPVGQLGLNNETKYSSPVQIPGTSWNKVVAGYEHTMANRTDGTLWVWGSGNNGALGVPSVGEASRSSPVQIPGTEWTGDIKAGRAGNLAIQEDTTP